jgi:D-amino-acid dehydrogenase
MSASTRVVVVGDGIVAASVAYHLARQGDVSVVTVEANLPGTATDAGAGIICPWADRRGRGEDPSFRLAADGARYYPDLLAMLAEDGQTETGYGRVGTLCVGHDPVRLEAIAAVLRSQLAARPEIGEVAVVPAGEPKRLFPPLAASLAGVWIGGGGRVDGRSIRDCLLRAAVRRGVRRMRGVAVLRHAAGRVDGVRVGREQVGADAVVVAAGAWTAEVCATAAWRLPVYPQRGQIVHAELAGADSASWPVILPPEDPYLLGFPAGRIVFGATREEAGFEYRATVGGVEAMLGAAIELAPGLASATMLETRIGFRPATEDGRAIVGTLTDGLIVATGNGAEGLTAGPWTGLAAAALAVGQQPPTDMRPFDPSRFERGAHGAAPEAD